VPVPAPAIAILGVYVFDSEHGAVVGPYDVLLRDGKIEQVAPPDPNHAKGFEVVDGIGKTLIPGLIDVHVHLGATVAVPGRLRIPDPDANAAAFVACGVTTVFDLATPIDALDRLRRHIASGKTDGPRIFGTGKPFTAPDGHPIGSIKRAFPSLLGHYAAEHIAWGVVTGDDVDRDLVRDYGRDAIKVVLDDVAGEPSISDEALERLSLASQALDLPLLAHVGRPSDVDRALHAHVTALMHAPYAGLLTGDQIAALIADHVAVAPTLAVWQDVADLLGGPIPVDDLARSVLTDRQLADLADPLGHAPDDPVFTRWVHEVADHGDDRIVNVRHLHDAGVTLLVGSDSPFLGLAAGASTHQELDRLEAAGLSGAEALRAATWSNSRFIDPNAQFGAIREGWAADLVLIDGDPIADPAAVHRIVDVWVGGRAVDRAPR
jgi:imidazolonepropionase-like amidohydrolase